VHGVALPASSAAALGQGVQHRIGHDHVARDLGAGHRLDQGFGQHVAMARAHLFHLRREQRLATAGRGRIHRAGSGAGRRTPGLAAIEKRSGTVATASAAQVREPIHQRFLDQWRRYADHLGPLQRALGALAY